MSTSREPRRPALLVPWPLLLPLVVGLAALLGAIEASVAGPDGATGLGWLAGATTATGLLALAGLALLPLSPRGQRRAGAVVAALLLALITLGALDLLAWSRANQGVSTLWQIARAEGWAGLQATLTASGVGVELVGALLAGVGLCGAAYGIGWSAMVARHAALLRLRPRGLAIALGLGLLGMVLPGGGGHLARSAARLYGPMRRAAQTIPAEVEPPSLRLAPPLPGGSFAPRRIERRTPDGGAPRLLLFVVVESLRHDAIDPRVTPSLAAAAADATTVEATYSAANATHPGWYTLFFARSPHLWHRLRRGAEPGGAVPLRLLRSAGYRVEFYSGAGLDYYDFEPMVCGPGGVNCDHRFDARDGDALGEKTRAGLDHLAIDRATAAMAAMADDGPPRALFVFLDGTHFPWTWLPGAEPAFAPVASESALRTGQLDATGVQGVRNRYRSSLAAVDAQLGRLFRAAAAADPNFALVVTGDHGEELLEHGRISHDSELCDVQVRVPLLLRLPGLPRGPWAVSASHADVMPTVLQAFGLWPSGPDDASLLAALDGRPLQRGSRRFALVVDTTAGSPGRAAIVDTRPGGAGERLEVVFSDREDVLASDRLHLLRIAGPDGRTRSFDLAAVLADPVRRDAFIRRWQPALAQFFAMPALAAEESDPRQFPRAGPQEPPYRVRYTLLAAHGAPANDALAPLPEPVTAEVALLLHNVGGRGWLHDVYIGHRWLHPDGFALRDFDDNPRQQLDRSVEPGERTAVLLRLSPPPSDAGSLEIDLVRDGVTWFRNAGNRSLRIRWPPAEADGAGSGAAEAEADDAAFEDEGADP
ncbi:MAG: sulfatase-like hydrolase/transferase [Deltaproteobacteria bacterium]|nr:sulfatase-like hydrolase/transferase [Deltaproteobacteria bacterium]